MLLSWRSLRKRLSDVLHLSDSPRRLAASLAIGVFISCTPFYGLHTLLAIGAAYVFRVNKVAAVTGAWLNLPWFAPFVYGLSLKVGEFILSGGEGQSFLSRLSLQELSAEIGSSLSLDHIKEGFLTFSKWMFMASKPLFLGTTIVGGVLAILTYAVALGAIQKIRRARGEAVYSAGRHRRDQ
jgi:uncharacterized protein (DUF2062 family)